MSRIKSEDSPPLEQDYQVQVNGEVHRVRAQPMARLLDVLRDSLRLTGTKEGCGEGECGACTVLLDGESVTSCLIPICQVANAAEPISSSDIGSDSSAIAVPIEITTIEATGHEAIQEAFLEHGGTQCGMCTPGMILQSRALLERFEGAAPGTEEVREALAGNLCRCTGYGKIITSVLAAWSAKS